MGLNILTTSTSSSSILHFRDTFPLRHLELFANTNSHSWTGMRTPRLWLSLKGLLYFRSSWHPPTKDPSISQSGAHSLSTVLQGFQDSSALDWFSSYTDGTVPTMRRFYYSQISSNPPLSGYDFLSTQPESCTGFALRQKIQQLMYNCWAAMNQGLMSTVGKQLVFLLVCFPQWLLHLKRVQESPEVVTLDTLRTDFHFHSIHLCSLLLCCNTNQGQMTHI